MMIMEQVQIKNSQMIGLKEMIATLVVSGVLFMIGIVVFAKVRATISTTDISVAANSTVNLVESTAYDAFELGVISLIVLAASVIIGILLRGIGG